MAKVDMVHIHEPGDDIYAMSSTGQVRQWRVSAEGLLEPHEDQTVAISVEPDRWAIAVHIVGTELWESEVTTWNDLKVTYRQRTRANMFEQWSDWEDV